MSLYSATMNSDLGLFSQYLTYIWSRLSWSRKMKHQNKLGLLPAKIFISTKSESWKLANEAAFFFKLPSVLYLHRYDISSIIFILTYLVKSEPNFCASSTHFSTSLQNVLKTNKKVLINWDPRESVFAIFYLLLWQQYNNSLKANLMSRVVFNVVLNS